MFLDQELKNIQDAKNRFVICSDLRRLLMQIEVRECGAACFIRFRISPWAWRWSTSFSV